MSFPADAVPDGAIFAPHHLTYALLAALLVAAVVWDDFRHIEPIGVAVGAGIALFGFLFVWAYYPVVGASMTLLGTTLALAAVVFSPVWDHYPLRYRVLMAFLILLALDDAISHAFGVWTPADWLWKEYLFGVMA